MKLTYFQNCLKLPRGGFDLLNAEMREWIEQSKLFVDE
jgi:hypothetical protein